MSQQTQLNVRVTTIEKFRRFITAPDDNTWDTEASLLESLRGEFTGNDKTRIGSAFHKIVELPIVQRELGGELIVDITQDGPKEKVLVPSNMVDVALEYKEAHPLMISEVPVTKTYYIGRFIVVVFGKIDGIEGRRGRDIKVKFRKPDPMEYMDSCQWKLYSDMAQLQGLDYDLFEVKYLDCLKSQAITEGGETYTLYTPVVTTGRDKKPRNLQLVIHEPICCNIYQDMERDCLQLLTQFVEYIENRNLFHLLQKVPYETSIL